MSMEHPTRTAYDPPPAYDDAVASSAVGPSAPAYTHLRDAGSHPQTNDDEQLPIPIRTALTPQSSAESSNPLQRIDSGQSLSKPCVIPQTRGRRNASTSTFVRAYAHELASHGISKADFMTFIDGLNEACVGTGGTVQLASGAESAAVSHGRTAMYVKAMNGRLFHPAGLHLDILSTEKMLRHIGFPEKSFPQISSCLDSTSMPNLDAEAEQCLPEHRAAEDTVSRQMQALDGCCAMLDYDVPANVRPDNLLKRMSNTQTGKMDRKYEKKMEKKYYKADKDEHKTERKVEKKQRKAEEKMSDLGRDIEQKRQSIDRNTSRIEGQMAAERARLEQKVNSANAQGDPKEVNKAHKEYSKEMRKLEKDLAKEHKDFEKERAKLNEDAEKVNRKADKETKKEGEKSRKAKMARMEDQGVKGMRWLVISRLEDGEAESEDLLSTAEGEGEAEEKEAVEVEAVEVKPLEMEG